MSLLVDYHIEKAMVANDLDITPWNQAFLGPASYDVTLAETYRVPKKISEVDVAAVPEDHTTLCIAHQDATGPFIRIMPGEFLLCTTNEVVFLSQNLAARVEGRSSLGRLGLQVHSTAGFIDPGFHGQVTLELANVAPWAIKLRPEMRIAQLAFFETSGPCRTPYGARGHYQNQKGPVESRLTL